MAKKTWSIKNSQLRLSVAKKKSEKFQPKKAFIMCASALSKSDVDDDFPKHVRRSAPANFRPMLLFFFLFSQQKS